MLYVIYIYNITRHSCCYIKQTWWEGACLLYAAVALAAAAASGHVFRPVHL